MKKTAIVLFNLGGPDSKESIRPFLFNFFTDPNIIRLPYPFRWLLAHRIASSRTKKEAGDSYRELGDKSPLLENSRAQARALEDLLNGEAGGNNLYKCFITMRYWHPLADETAQEVKAWEPDNIILLPLYPQYSTTTTRSSFQEWQKAAKKTGLDKKPFNLVCCYSLESGFIAASAENVRTVYDRAVAETGLKPRVLFSAHGLPESVVKDGDPYQEQCELSAAAIAAATGVENLDWKICYQSRIGPRKWLGPSTEECVHEAIKDGVPLVILPHAFTQEHVETLVEIDIEYRHIAEKAGIKGYYKAETVGTHPAFIRGLAAMALAAPSMDVIAPYPDAACCGRHRRCPTIQYAGLNKTAGKAA
ncbi:MAG: ferrochelatase [Micavibrio sp.]